MDTAQLKTILAVMNLTAGYGMIYVAEPEVAGTLDEKWGIEARYRFYLISDDAALLSEEGIIRA